MCFILISKTPMSKNAPKHRTRSRGQNFVKCLDQDYGAFCPWTMPRCRGLRTSPYSLDTHLSFRSREPLAEPGVMSVQCTLELFQAVIGQNRSQFTLCSTWTLCTVNGPSTDKHHTSDCWLLSIALSLTLCRFCSKFRLQSPLTIFRLFRLPTFCIVFAFGVLLAQFNDFYSF